MNHDDLVVRIQERAVAGPDEVADRAGRSWPCARETSDSVRSAEALLGFALPPLLRRLYLEVGNGGFGPGYGILPLKPPNDDAEHWDGSVLALYRAFRHPDPDDPAWTWPSGLLPICEWGCAIYSCVDVAYGDPFPVVTFDPNVRGPREPMAQAFATTHAAFAVWLGDWLAGANLWEAMFEVDPERSRVGTNPFTKEPVTFVATKLRRGEPSK